MWLDYFATYLRETFPQFLREKPWNYKDDLCVVGAYDLYGATGEARWLEPIRASAPFLMDDAGRVAGWQPGEHNLDKVSFGKSLRILGQLTGEARYARGAQAAFRMLADYPRTVTGNFWHKDIYPHQVWLDGLYMAMPFYAACLDEYGADGWDDILNQFASAHCLLWDEAKGLYRHANDCSRQAGWADPATGQSPAVWLRAEGWFLMALADTYELARAHTPRAGELAALLQNAVEGLLQFKEVNLFLRGLVPMVGYPSSQVYYERAERFAGESKYPLKKMLAFAFEGITSFSTKPLKFISYQDWGFTLSNRLQAYLTAINNLPSLKIMDFIRGRMSGEDMSFQDLFMQVIPREFEIYNQED